MGEMVSTIERPQGPNNVDHPAMIDAVTTTTTVTSAIAR
jgi:hypothetical protein